MFDTLATVFSLFLIVSVSIKSSYAISAYDKFIEKEDKAGIIWMKIILEDSSEAALACQGQSVVLYPVNSKESVLVQKNITDDIACVNFLTYKFYDVAVEKCPNNFSIPIARVTKNSKAVDSKVVKTKIIQDVIFFRNRRNRSRPCVVNSQTYTVRDTNDWTLDVKGRLTSDGQIAVPLVTAKDAEIMVKFTPKGPYRKTRNETKTVKSLAKKGVLPARSTIRVIRYIQETLTVHRYSVNLEVDEQESNHFKILQFFKKYVEKGTIEPHFYNSLTGFYVDFNQDKIMINNVPAVETVKIHDVKDSGDEVVPLDALVVPVNGIIVDV